MHEREKGRRCVKNEGVRERERRCEVYMHTSTLDDFLAHLCMGAHNIACNTHVHCTCTLRLYLFSGGTF